MKRLARALSVCLLMTSCAQAARPAAVHIPVANGNLEHDEIVYPSGDVMDIYPDRASPHELIFHKSGGGKIDAICLNATCSDVHLQISGSKLVADGAYQLLQTDDPNLVMVRDEDGNRTLGYLVRNTGGSQFFGDLQQAQAYETRGDTARTIGKVVAGTLLVVAIVALAGAAAAAEAHANTVTTR